MSRPMETILYLRSIVRYKCNYIAVEKHSNNAAAAVERDPGLPTTVAGRQAGRQHNPPFPKRILVLGIAYTQHACPPAGSGRPRPWPCILISGNSLPREFSGKGTLPLQVEHANPVITPNVCQRVIVSPPPNPHSTFVGSMTMKMRSGCRKPSCCDSTACHHRGHVVTLRMGLLSHLFSRREGEIGTRTRALDNNESTMRDAAAKWLLFHDKDGGQCRRHHQRRHWTGGGHQTRLRPPEQTVLAMVKFPSLFPHSIPAEMFQLEHVRCC